MNHLLPGEEAPEFEAITFDGVPFSSKDCIGQQKVWLAFYRYANCPICHHHLFEVAQLQEKLAKANVRVVAIFESKGLKFGKLSTDTRFPKFPMISDPDGSLYEAYGVEKRVAAFFHLSVAFKFVKAALAGFNQGPIDGSLTRVPAHFLIDEDGMINTAYYGKTIADHIPWEMVEDFLREHPALEVS